MNQQPTVCTSRVRQVWTMPPPTRLERAIRARIDLRIFKTYVGTGHLVRDRRQRPDGDMTDSGDMSDSDVDSSEGLDPSGPPGSTTSGTTDGRAARPTYS